MQTIATYFDGESSKSHHVEINFDERNNSLMFLSSEFKDKVWRIEDLDFQNLDYCLEISNTTNPLELLKITDPDFVTYFLDTLNRGGKLSTYQKLLHSGLKTHIIIAVLLLGFLASTYFFVIPWVGEQSVVMIPTEFDNYLSNDFLIDYLADNKVDSVKTTQLTAFASYVDFKNTKPLSFVVVESEIVNAFALPDGKIIVFTGLLDKMKSYKELTALLSHEAVHINKRHSVKMLARNLAGYIFISAMFSDVNGIMSIIAENAENLQSLSYSRKFEDEADAEGVLLMMHNNIDPHGMITLFSRLKEEKNVLPTFLSTHPVTIDRIQSIRVLIGNSKYKNLDNKQLKLHFDKLIIN
jgi:Zn-dependent protease with chaperone function